MSPPPPRKATRIVRLSELPADPLDFQLNIYDYRHLRLFKDTDVFVGPDLVYQVGQIGCRGPNPAPGKPILAIFGDDEVHGPLQGGFVERLAIDGFHTLNAGVENLTLEDVAQRFEEVKGAVGLTAVVVAPPARALPLDPESWRILLGRFTGPPVVAFLPARGAGAQAFNRVLVDYCASHGKLFIPVPGCDAGWSFADRLLGKAKGPADLADLIAARLARPLAGLRAPAAAAPVPAPAPNAKSKHGPGDTGRNYPLW